MCGKYVWNKDGLVDTSIIGALKSLNSVFENVAHTMTLKNTVNEISFKAQTHDRMIDMPKRQ